MSAVVIFVGGFRGLLCVNSESDASLVQPLGNVNAQDMDLPAHPQFYSVREDVGYVGLELLERLTILINEALVVRIRVQNADRNL